MPARTRREFLQDVGRGTLIAGLGSALALELDRRSTLADESSVERPLDFGPLESLVRAMQDTDPDKLLPLLADKLKSGVELRTLVAGAALANARTFGGQDYVGFHTLMALSPAYRMAQELPSARRALPVLKVLYRNNRRIHEHGGHASERLKSVDSQPASAAASTATAESLLAAVRRQDMAAAELTFAALSTETPQQAFDRLLPTVQDNIDVHRIVLPYRAWDLLDIVGPEHAHTLLRQSVRYCVANENPRNRAYGQGARDALPKLLDQHKLAGAKLGSRPAEDGWVDKLSQTIFESSPEQAADAAAAALAEGFAPAAVAEAVSLAANQLVLRDAGRPAAQASPGKPAGSVHGDSIGVHACDSANAWRNMARSSTSSNAIACLILSAYQVAHDRTSRGGDFLKWQPYPTSDALVTVSSGTPEELLSALKRGIESNDQSLASAAVARYAATNAPPRTVFDVLLQYAVSEDGALHAEKYYRTVSEEFAATRPAFRWRQVVALARVTASEFGQRAAGYDEACRLLNL